MYLKVSGTLVFVDFLCSSMSEALKEEKPVAVVDADKQNEENEVYPIYKMVV